MLNKVDVLFVIGSLSWSMSFAFTPRTRCTTQSPLTRSRLVQPRSSLSATDSQTTTRSPPTYLPIEVVQSMPEWLPTNLKNDYYLLRHGQSTSNVEGVISSNRTLAYSTQHGLTELGIDQARGAAEPLLRMVQSRAKAGDKLVFVASPFARAHQTAQACLDKVLAFLVDETSRPETDLEIVDNVILHDNLVERNFGRLDGQELFTYAYVWPLDKFNVTHTAFDVESVAAVCHRIRQCILDLEETQFSTESSRHQRYHIVLTSHADVLQISQLYAARASNVGEFSSYRFTNGEVRYMGPSTDNLPEPSPLPRPVRGTFIP